MGRAQNTDKKALPTAPELPVEVAKQYGIHHDTHPNHASVVSPETPKQDEPAAGVDSPGTSAAIDDIAAEEVKAAETSTGQMPPVQPKRGFWRKIGHFFARWWGNKIARWTTITILLLGTVAVIAIPQARYFVLNNAGVRSNAGVTVKDQGTQLPLKNVKVSLGGRSAMTDIHGRATVRGIRLGPQTLKIEKLAFATVAKKVTVGWGSNPLGDFSLDVTGFQYPLLVRDHLSGKPLEGIEAEADEVAASALSDKAGKINLALSSAEMDVLHVTLKKSGFRSESITLDLTKNTPLTLDMVPANKEVFITKESGRYDLVSMYADGKDRKILLAGTGSENNNVALAVSPDGQQAALVSTREQVRDGDGYLLSTLSLVDIADGTVSSIDHAVQIRLVDWSGSRLIYQATISAPSSSTSSRNRLVSYNADNGSKVQLTSVDRLNSVSSIAGQIYYAVASSDANTKAGLYRIKIDGTGRQTLLNKEVWTTVRSAYDTLSLQTPDGWYVYQLGQTSPGKVVSATLEGRPYIELGDGRQSLWVDNRDGKGTLLIHDSETKKDRIIASADGLTYPVRWLDAKHVVYRVSNAGETADYGASIDGGTPRKLTDLTNAYGLSSGF